MYKLIIILMTISLINSCETARKNDDTQAMANELCKCLDKLGNSTPKSFKNKLIEHKPTVKNFQKVYTDYIKNASYTEIDSLNNSIEMFAHNNNCITEELNKYPFNEIVSLMKCDFSKCMVQIAKEWGEEGE